MELLERCQDVQTELQELHDQILAIQKELKITEPDSIKYEVLYKEEFYLAICLIKTRGILEGCLEKLSKEPDMEFTYKRMKQVANTYCNTEDYFVSIDV